VNKLTTIVVGILLVFGLAGCGGIESGTVTQKVYQPSSTTTIFIPIQTGSICHTISTGSTITQSCTPIFTSFPFIVHDDEDWVLKLEEEGKTGWVYVSEEKYNNTKIGDYYTKGKQDATSDDKTKTRA
jgi:hypothetical protein